jgi:hypothetical protein
MNTKILPLLSALLLSLAPAARAQETTIALGRVASAGDLQGSTNPIGATITTTRPGTGEYEITVAAPGAFVGDGVGDFLVQAMVRTVGLTDRACSTRVVSVDPDTLVAAVYVADMEDNTNLNAPEPGNLSFQFAIHRLPSGGTTSPASRYLHATGSVTNGGFLLGGATADGSILSVSQLGDGDYRVILSKTGAFPHGLGDYIVLASSGSTLAVSDNILSGAPSSINPDELQITVRAADVQNASNVNPEAEDEAFHFAIYRTVEAEAIGNASSRLLLGMASVQGDNGLLRRGLTSIPGAFLTAERSGIGRYNLIVNAPGQFAGRTVDDYVVQIGINSPTHTDISGNATPFLIDANSITINIRTNDLQVNGQLLGVAADSDFFLTIHDAVANSRSDLRIGRKSSLSTMKGNGIFNSNARGQTITTTPSSTGLVKIHLATENDGNITGDLITRGKRGKGLSKTRVFRVDGGKTNVTAAFRTSGDAVAGIRPGAIVRHEVRTTLRPDSPMSRVKLRFSAGPGTGDSALAQITRKR